MKAARSPLSMALRFRSVLVRRGPLGFARFCERYADPRPRVAGWMMPRGQGKSTLVAALGLYDLMLGEEGAASVVVAATDERRAGIVFNTAAAWSSSTRTRRAAT